MATNKQLLERLDRKLDTLMAYTAGLITQVTIQGAQMSEQVSELDQAVDQVQAAVSELGGRLGGQLDTIANLNAQIGDLQADDSADAAEIERLTAERDSALTDAQENVGRLSNIRDEVSGLAPATPEEPPA